MVFWLLLLAAWAGRDPVVAEIGPLVVTADELRTSSVRLRDGKDDLEARKALLDGILDRHAAFLRVRDELLKRDPSARQIWATQWLARKFPLGDYHWEPEELYAYWEAHQADFARPSELAWQWIVVKETPQRPAAEARALAEELRVIGDEQPEWLANAVRELQDPNVTITSGKGKAPAKAPSAGTPAANPVAELAFGLPESEIVSEVVATPGGFGFVRLVDRYAPIERDFSDAQRDVKRAMLTEVRVAAADEYGRTLIPAEVYADPARREAAIAEALYQEAVKMGLDEDANVQRKVVNRWLDLEGVTSTTARKLATAKLAQEGRDKFPPKVDEVQLEKVQLRK